MGKRRPVKRQDEIVGRFAARLREVRLARGMTQADLAEAAKVTETYVTKLEAGRAAPGIDLVNRLAKGLSTTVADLLPQDEPPDPAEVLRKQAKKLADDLIKSADRETLQVLVPLLARLGTGVR
ncbi:MAG: helix-turn-helix transcriptional regulator [Gemmataceae bacterium]|jgi:transcriptional regulator with XRE-family HTH domain|nr:helix-turn-helix transcriptional regulator [Gemmataceae bacterium]